MNGLQDMFTGLIENVGEVRGVERLSSGARIHIALRDSPSLVRGESVAINGVCLTVLPSAPGEFTADLSPETLARTTLGTLETGTVVNVERALTLGSRLGGHMVQGHIDGVGTLVSVENEGEFARYRWSCPAELASLLINKGSIAVDGVSLTVVDPDQTSFAAALIPETLQKTNLGRSLPGQTMNLEIDMIAKYVQRLVLPYHRG